MVEIPGSIDVHGLGETPLPAVPRRSATRSARPSGSASPACPSRPSGCCRLLHETGRHSSGEACVIELRVNGRTMRAVAPRPTDAARGAPPRARDDGRARGVRHRDVRRLHGASPTAADQPRAWRSPASPMGRDVQPSRAWPGRTASSRPPAGLRRPHRVPVLLLHAGLPARPRGAPRGEPRTQRRGDPRTCLAGNLCRCGSYLKIIDAVQDAAGRAKAKAGAEAERGRAGHRHLTDPRFGSPAARYF